MTATTENPSVLAELRFEQEWNLSPSGTSNSLRYWAHVHFEGDAKWGQELWTLFVELEKPPIQGKKEYLAKVYFMAPNAPFHFLRSGQKFELCVGKVVRAQGVIK